MINIMLSGANGKMGHVISRIVAESSDSQILFGVDINTEQHFGYSVYDNPELSTETPDVIIDFSHPSAFETVTSYAKKHNIPIVVATTGLSKEQVQSLNELSNHIPVFFSANMSLGVNLIIELAKAAVKTLEGNFDIEIIEKHHNKKIDAPSGTALAIADSIADTLTEKTNYVYDRHSARKKRAANEIGLHSVRGGTIVGEHEIIFAGNDEIIEIKHTAMSKEIFAVGSYKAAKFLLNKKPGMYKMADLVNEK